MKQKNAAEFASLVKAWGEGRTLQLCNIISGVWEDLGPDINFDQPPDCYRLKPEPREFFLILYPDGSMESFSTDAEREESWKCAFQKGHKRKLDAIEKL